MNKKRLVTLIVPLIWLLFLCSSQVRTEAQDTLKPKLVILNNETEIDYCDSNIKKEFYLTIDLGTSINTTDSLFIAEIILLYKKEKIFIDGQPLLLGTLFEKFKPEYTLFKKWKASEENEYDTIFVQGMSIHTPVSGNARLINFSGKLLLDTIDCGDIILKEVYFGKDFKKPYIMSYPDSIKLCLVKKDLSNRKIEFKEIENNYTIDSLEDTLKIDFFVEVKNKKNLKNFNIELNINNEFFDNIKILNVYSDYIIKIENITDIYCKIKIDNIDTTNINSVKILTAELIRKRKEQANVILNCEINEINENACSMNGDKKQIEIDLPKLNSIIEELNEKITILDKNGKIILKSIDEIKYCKLVNLYGMEIDYGIEKIGQNEILFDKKKLVSGVYFVRIITNNKTKYFQNIKLIIN